MKDKRFELIAKYALVLTILQILSVTINRMIVDFEFLKNVSNNGLLRVAIPLIFNVALNLVAAFIVGRDIKTYKVKTQYVTMATIVYRPLGVFAFLLFLFLQDEFKSTSPEESKLI